jgi:riboflavin-specific deaminase-like protein
VTDASESGAGEDRGEEVAPVRLAALLPGGPPLTPDEASTGLRLGELAPPGRPHLALNMVASADGKATLGGRTAGLGGRPDRELFHGLRTQVDAVMVGAGTARVERYGRIVRDPARREKREREGLARDPLACVVSARLAGLEDLPLLADPEQRVVVVTGGEGSLGPVAAPVEYVRAPSRGGAGASLDLVVALRELRERHDVRSILCEGGPTLNAALLHADLVDELFLSLAPKLAGGADALTIVAGAALPEPTELELVRVLESGGELFLRLRVAGRRGTPADGPA